MQCFHFQRCLLHRTEQNILIRLNKLTEFTTHKKIITGRLPEKPCGSTIWRPQEQHTPTINTWKIDETEKKQKRRENAPQYAIDETEKKTNKESECTTIHNTHTHNTHTQHTHTHTHTHPYTIEIAIFQMKLYFILRSYCLLFNIHCRYCCVIIIMLLIVSCWYILSIQVYMGSECKSTNV